MERYNNAFSLFCIKLSLCIKPIYVLNKNKFSKIKIVELNQYIIINEENKKIIFSLSNELLINFLLLLIYSIL